MPLKYLSNFWRTLEIPLINSGREVIRAGEGAIAARQG